MLQIKEGHLDLFYREELVEREKFKYPPYYRLIKIVVKDKDKKKGQNAANKLSLQLKCGLTENRVMGPIEPLINKIRNYYLYEILIKIERQTLNSRSVKEFISVSRDTLLALPDYKSVLVHFDVDPI